MTDIGEDDNNDGGEQSEGSETVVFTLGEPDSER